MAEPVHAPQRTLWSILALAEQFDRPWNTVKRKLKKVPPDGKLNGKPAWFMSTAAPYLVGAPADDDDSPEDLDRLSAKERLDWVRSERELMRLRVDAGELLPISEHRDAMAYLAKLFVTALDTLPDVLERKTALSGKQAEIVQQVCDELRQKVYKANADDRPAP